MAFRSCIACRKVCLKQELIRIVLKGETIVVDDKGCEPGRGAYLHPRFECWSKAVNQKLLAFRFRVKSRGDKVSFDVSEVEKRVRELIKQIPAE